MSDIPVTAKAFEAWWDTMCESAPPELQVAAIHARLTLWMLENNPRDFIEQLPTFRSQIIRDLTAFAEAYGAWKVQTTN